MSGKVSLPSVWMTPPMGKAETMDHQHFLTEALLTRERLIKRLLASTKVTTTALASALTNCTDDVPCLDGACPVCGLKFQKAAVELIEQVIGKAASACRGRMSMMTIVSATGIADPDDLTVAVFTQVIAEVKAALQVVGCPPGILSVDVSFNEDLTGEVPPHWCVHVHGIFMDWLSLTQKVELKGWFPSSDKVKVPVKVVPLDDRPDAPLYVCKPQRERRETYLDDSGRNERRPHRATRNKVLRPAQAVALAGIEHRVGLMGRLFGHGISDEVIQRHFEAFLPQVEAF